jgi:hypothetical protein
MANARTVVGAAHDPSATELVRALATEFETSEGRASTSTLSHEKYNCCGRG